jgi:hypothetical protein
MEAGNFSSPNDDFKKKWNYKSTLLIGLHGLKRNNFTFTFNLPQNDSQYEKYKILF